MRGGVFLLSSAGARVLLAGAVAVAVLAPGAAAAARPVRAVEADNATGFAFRPQVKRTVKGRRVTWVNKTDLAHTLVFYKGPGEIRKFTLGPQDGSADTKKRRFKRRGTYKYFCTQQGHAIKEGDSCTGGMCGTVRVRRPE